MARGLFCVAFGVSTLLTVRTAAAECTNHWIGTPTGTAIPAEGALYVYDDALAYGPREPKWEISGDGVVESTITIVGDRVARIGYRTDGTWLRVDATARLGRGATARYIVAPEWEPGAQPRVIRYAHEIASSWDSGTLDALALQIRTPVAALRVRWRHANRDVERIIPARERLLDDGDKATALTRGMVLDLGTVPCTAPTLDPKELEGGGALVITAIRLDGSEIALAGVPEWVHLGSEKANVLRAIAINAPATDDTAPAAAVSKTGDDDSYPWPRWTGLIIAALAIAISRAGRRKNTAL